MAQLTRAEGEASRRWRLATVGSVLVAYVVGDALVHGGLHFFACTLVVAGVVMATSAAPWLDVRSWGSTAAERALAFPCDRHLPVHDDALFRAIDVDVPAPLLFRWLCQLRLARSTVAPPLRRDDGTGAN